MAYTDEHINVLTEEGVRMGMGMGLALTALTAVAIPTAAIARDNATRLQTRINEIASFTDSRRFAYLYFPPGRYYLGRPAAAPSSALPQAEFGDIVIPPEITLWFAPGAVLVPMAWPDGSNDREGEGLTDDEKQAVRVEIHGDIIADRRQIFGLWQRETEPSRKAGIILLAGDRIREVYPEWWMAQINSDSNLPERTTKAIQAAIDAAYHRRVTPRRVTAATLPAGTLVRVPGSPDAVEWNRRPSIPVVLMGQYSTNAEIHVGVPAGWTPPTMDRHLQPPMAGFELEGERGIGTTGTGMPSITADSQTGFTGRAILAIRGPAGFSIRNVTLDGQHKVSACVTVEPIDAAWSAATFDGCSFLRASTPSSVASGVRRGAQVILDAETLRRPSRPGAPGAPRGPRDFWNVSFTRCAFQPSALDTTALLEAGQIPDEANNLVGVEVRLGDNEGLEFLDCWFRGAASPGIRAFSGRFAMKNCKLHFWRPARWGYDAIRSRGTYEDVPVMSPVGNLWVHRDWGLPDFPHGSDVIIEDPVPVDSMATGVEPVIPASFTLNDHLSHSWQLFAAKRIGPDAFSACRASPVIVLNAKSNLEAPASFLGEREFEPPSVYWPSGGPGAIGSPLVLIGCEFIGLLPTFADPNPIARSRFFLLDERERLGNVKVVLVGGGLTGPVFNIGSNVYDPAIRGTGLSPAVSTGDERITLTVIHQLVPRVPT